MYQVNYNDLQPIVVTVGLRVVSVYYVNSLMNAIKIDSMVTKTSSAVWVRIMKPKQQSIIIGCLYHPTSKTGQDSTNTIDYLAKLSNRYKNSKFILFRDFNHLSMEAISEAFRLCE